MDLYCTRPGCSKPVNSFADLDDTAILKSTPQRYCAACQMPLILTDRYLPTKLLGQGGFGAAFLACDRHTPALRKCVVKQFLPSKNLSPSQLQTAQVLFEREAQALDELGNAHPQIPDLFAFFELTVPTWQPGKQERLFYLVQEYIDGQTMEEELHESGVFSSEAVMTVLREILIVLQFVHDKGAIHRDIKPTNIMRHRNGLIYLLDFGAVRQVTKGGKSTGIYSEGYAPPEQMNGSEVYPSSDLYALAVTCTLLLTGKQPTDLYDGYHNLWRWRPDAPQVDPRLADVLDRMLKTTPSERFQSAEEVLQALQAIAQSPLATPATLASPQSPRPLAETTLPPEGMEPRSPHSRRRRRRFLLELESPYAAYQLGGTGIAGGVLAIAIVSGLGLTWVSVVVWLGLWMAWLALRSWLARGNWILLASLSVAVVILLPTLPSRQLAGLANPALTLAIVAFAAAIGAIILSLFYPWVMTRLRQH